MALVLLVYEAGMGWALGSSVVVWDRAGRGARSIMHDEGTERLPLAYPLDQAGSVYQLPCSKSTSGGRALARLVNGPASSLALALTRGSRGSCDSAKPLGQKQNPGDISNRGMLHQSPPAAPRSQLGMLTPRGPKLRQHKVWGPLKIRPGRKAARHDFIRNF